MNNNFKGCYRHFKGNNYEVLGKATDKSTNESFIFYQQLYPPFRYWIRPYDMFFSFKEMDGESIRRFSKIADSQKNILKDIDIFAIDITNTETRKQYIVLEKDEDEYFIRKK